MSPPLQIACCPTLATQRVVHGPATSDITWELVRNTESDNLTFNKISWASHAQESLRSADSHPSPSQMTLLHNRKK